MQTISQLNALRTLRAEWRKAGETVALVPTMGALHAGHLKLVEEAKNHAKRVIVSIFVNPTQFGKNEDFSKYPRPIERDIELLEQAGADALWNPEIEVMYPEGFGASIHISGITEMLEGEHRKGHFDGVALIVAKLLLQAAPEVALFGEKDYQQLCLIKRLVKDLDIDTTVIGVPTVREADGLALSSRNAYLSAQDRPIAAELHRKLQNIARTLKADPKGLDLAIAEARQQLRAAGFARIDYLELRAEDTLAPMTELNGPARLLTAAWLGMTRLIDNIKVE